MNNNEPFFSFLIANYNNGQYIQETLNCIFKQTYTNWEIVIVDDGSTDSSLSIYKQLAGNPQIRIFYNEENKGTGYTKRRCVKEAKGEICGFIDPDDTLTENAASLMVKTHQKHSNASIIHSKYIICDDKLNEVCRTQHQGQCVQSDTNYLNLDYKIGAFATFKKKYYDKTEGISSHLKRAVDQDLYLKLYEVGDTIFLDEYLYYYRIHKGGISTMSNVGKAHFWHWTVIIEASKRRNINIEDLFVTEFVDVKIFNELNKKYLYLKKYEKLNNFLKKIRSKLCFIK